MIEHFWEQGGYKIDGQRILDNIQQCDLLNKYFEERATIEADYAKKLKVWNEKMLKNIEKSTLYGTHQKGLVEITMQTEKMANRHQKMYDKIHSDCASRLREWKKGAYHTKLMGGYKEVDQLNADFKKAQKNWLKMEERVEQQKMRYHRVCHELTQNETRAKQDEQNIEKDKYNEIIEEISEMAPTYIGEMKRIHQKSQNTEKRKIQFFSRILTDFVDVVANKDLASFYSQISDENHQSIDNISAAIDLDEWNQKINLDSDCPIPAFQEFDPAVPMAVTRTKSRNGTVKRNSVKTNSAENGTSQKSVRVKVLYDYAAADEDEISLKKGEFLDEVKPEDDQGWSVGRLSDGTEGVYPSKYVEPVL